MEGGKSVGSPARAVDPDYVPNFGPKLPAKPARRQRSGVVGASATATAEAAASNDNGTAPAPASSKPQPSMPKLPSRPSGAKTAPSGSAAASSSGAAGAAAAAAAPPPPTVAAEVAKAQRLRDQIHNIRICLVRAAGRLGYDQEHQMVKQVLYRLQLAEKIHAREARRAPGGGSTSSDPAAAAAREAAALDVAHGRGSAVGLSIRILLLGFRGVGKTRLAHALLGIPPPPGRVDVASGGLDTATTHVNVVHGMVAGLDMSFVDTPGLRAAASEVCHNRAVIRQVAAAMKRHRPDMVLYVSRFDDVGGVRGELPVLRALTDAIGADKWLNTIVALTHACAEPPCATTRGRDGRPTAQQVPYSQYATQRSHLLQAFIRQASGDERLMNPMAYVECEPCCRQPGHPVVESRDVEQMLLMAVAAKLLADTEALVQAQQGPAGSGKGPGSAGGSGAPSQAELLRQMYGPRQMPVGYLLQSACQLSQPLRYPDHDNLVALYNAETTIDEIYDPYDQRQAGRSIRDYKARLEAERQVKARDAEANRGTLAGGAFVQETPPGAPWVRGSAAAAPVHSYRYRVLEPAEGTVTKPHIERHGLDGTDGVEGVVVESAGVMKRTPPPRRRRRPRVASSKEATGSGSSSSSTKLAQPAPAAALPPSSLLSSAGGGGGGAAAAPTSAATPSSSGSATDVGRFASTSTASDNAAVVAAESTAPAGAGTSRAAAPATPSTATGDDDSGGSSSGGGSPSRRGLLIGVPYHHVVSASCSKDSFALKARSEATLYHDPLGRTTTSLALDAQSSAAPGTQDFLVTLRADVARSGLVSDSHRLVGGMAVTRLAEGPELVKRGQTAVLVRVEDSFRLLSGGGSWVGPLDVSGALAHVLPRDLWGAREGGGWSGLGEATLELKDVLRSKWSVPLVVSGSRSAHNGEATSMAGATLQGRSGRRGDTTWAGRLVVYGGSSGDQVSLTLSAQSGKGLWAAAAAVVPFGNLVAGWARSALTAWQQQRQQQQRAAGSSKAK